jgi:DUF1680 family protein
MRPRVVHPHPSIDAIRGSVAVERGPLVLVLESTDLPEGQDVAATSLLTAVPPAITSTGASVSLRLDGIPAAEWPYGSVVASSEATTITANLVPYFSWANRGPSTMRVWIPTA